MEWSDVVELAEQALALQPENSDAQGVLRLAKRQLARAESTELSPSIPPTLSSTGGSFIGRREGNPLFALELVRWLDRPGRDLAETRVPEGIREVIGRRLNRLSADAERVLQMAGVLGLHFTFDQLVTVFSELDSEEISEGGIVDAVAELIDAGFVGEEGGGEGRLLQVHPRLDS